MKMYLDGPTGLKSVDVHPSQIETMIARGYSIDKPSKPKALASTAVKDTENGES